MVNLRTLVIDDVGQALELSRTESWNQTEVDWGFLIGTPENVCLAAVIDEKIVGTATATVYNERVAWIGMVLVNREYRRKGISKLLLSGLFEKLKHCRSIKLDATPAGQPVYKKLGFKDEYQILRMTNFYVTEKDLSLDEDDAIKQISNNDFNEIIEYDNQVFGANRQNLIEFLLRNNQENSWVVKREGRISGFALGRKGKCFYQVGPVLTSSVDDTKKLILKSLEKLKGQPVVIDVLEDKKELVSWLKIQEFTIQRPFVRMYQNKNPNPGIPENQFLICGPEFG